MSDAEKSVILSNFGSRDGVKYAKDNRDYGKAIGATQFFPLAWIPLLWTDSLREMIASGEVKVVKTPSRYPGRPDVTLLVKGATS